MFSEYASKFLAQSQSRMSAIREGRLNVPHTSAPLFHSAADFLPEDPEHEQEVQDLYALQSSRRHFGAYAPSTAVGDEDEDDEEGEYSEDSTQELRRSRGKQRGRFAGPSNIRSSWRVPRPGGAARPPASESVFSNSTERGTGSGKGKGRMVDVALDDSEHLGMEPEYIDHSDMVQSPRERAFGGYARKGSFSDEDDDQPPDELTLEMPREESPPPFQSFKRPPREASPSLPFAADNPREGLMPRSSSPGPKGPHESVIPQQVYHPNLEPPTHDHLWSTLYIVLMVCMFATSLVVWLQTEEPQSLPFDSIYGTLHKSLKLLTVDTFVAVAVSVIWMYLLRSFVKPLVYLLLVSVPMILVALSIYPFVVSFKDINGGKGAQGIAMRWGSIVPAAAAVGWVYAAWKGRNALQRAIGIITLACRILGENAALFLLSFGTLAITCVFTWIWVGMFTRAFLTGNIILKGAQVWNMSSQTIALGVYYIMMYLWTLGISSGIHRATSAATVSQWYFYRHAIPRASSKAIMGAALHHSTTTLFGTICFSALAALLVRVPLYIAPRRIAGFIHLLCFNFIASPIAALIDPLTLTYAAIHSQPLISASRAITNLKFIDNAGFGPKKHPRAAYRLARMLLTAARGITALSLGIGGWIYAAKDINSGYGYLVGLIAGCIGWAVIGATEGSLSNIVDSTLVCVGSDNGGGGSHCREAQMVFGG